MSPVSGSGDYSMDTEVKPFLKQEELARRWCMSGRTLEAWRLKGVGPAYVKIGARVLYRVSDILDAESRQSFPVPFSK
jgi:hypothetical protein